MIRWCAAPGSLTHDEMDRLSRVVVFVFLLLGLGVVGWDFVESFLRAGLATGAVGPYA